MKNKFLAMAFSVVVAFGLWLFVITVVSPESEKTYFDIPVVLQNKDVLSQRGLMIVSDTPKVTLALKSDRSTLNELNENNINVIADLSTVEKDGTHNLTYTISYPGNVSYGSVSVMSSSTEMITLKVENRITKNVDIVVPTEELEKQLDKDYILNKIEMFRREDNKDVPVTSVEISGPESVVGKIVKATIDDLDLKGKTETFSDSYVYTLCDEDGKAVNAEKVTTNVDVVQVTAQIVKERTIDIVAQVIPGKGAEESNAKVTLGQQSIVVRGEKDRVDAMPASVTVPVNLAEHFENSTFEVDLNELGLDLSGMEIHTGKEKVEVTLELEGVAIGEFTIPVKIANLPEGMEIASKAEEITVTIRGPVNDIRKINGSDLLAQVDCAAVTEGRNELTATITCEKYPKVAVTNGEHKVMLDIKVTPTEATQPQK